MKIIGIHGRKRTGKDTTALYLQDRLHGKTKIKYFATPVKQACAAIFQVPLVAFDGNNPNREEIIPKWGMSHRQMMTSLSDITREQYGSDLYVRVMDNQLHSCRVFGVDFVIIGDVRYPWEADFIYKEGGFIIHLARDTDEDTDHSSEAGLCPKWGVDFQVNNNSSIGFLHNQLNKIIDVINPDPLNKF